jgi:hypothetical protein
MLIQQLMKTRFSANIKRTSAAKEPFKIVDDFLKEESIKWSDSVGVCMDAPRIMAGNKEGLQAVTKRSALEAVWTHCMIHCESLATKELCLELNEVMDTVIRTVNYRKTSPRRIV